MSYYRRYFRKAKASLFLTEFANHRNMQRVYPALRDSKEHQACSQNHHHYERPSLRFCLEVCLSSCFVSD